MSAAELRAAADRLDALADAATPGPWFAAPWDFHPERPLVSWGVIAEPEELIADAAPEQMSDGLRCGNNAAYIAAMHPAVAKALAAWLRATADAHGHDEDEAPFSLWDLPGMDQHPALAVARALSPP